MTLFRRKLWGDRATWLVVAAATVFVVNGYLSRHSQTRLYILYAWAFLVACLIFFSELRVGRRKPAPAPGALYTGWAAFIGEEQMELSGQRSRGWRGTAPGVLSFEPAGMRWTPLVDDHGPAETLAAWPDVYSFRLTGVLPLVGRASGYLWLSLFGGRELVFHVHAVRRWRKALREAMIVGATHVAPPPAPPQPAPVPAAEPEAMGEEPAAMVTAAPVHRIFSEDVDLEPVIGIECHVELDTHSKMFCGCPTTFGASPNSNVCEICTGQPGTLPVPNREAIERAMKIALALNCAITPHSIFHRKNYFYPDMPKNYQISQYDIPLATDGYLDYEIDGETRRVGIERVHIEEDTGKTLHAGEGGRIGVADYTLVDYNRAGIPLVEIVTKPDLHSPEDARAYVAELRTLLLALGVSDVRMEEGSMRCDANVSVRPQGSAELGTKTEVKNMNSLRSLQRALAYEIDRQSNLLRDGEEVVQETRHFDENRGVTIGGRAKEYSSDYRYFPDPDLAPLAPDAMWINDVRSQIPELPAARRQRFVTDLGLADADARTLIAAGVADAFEEAAKAYGGQARAVARWYLGELAQAAGERGVDVAALGVVPVHVAELQRLVDDGAVSDTTAKGQVLKEMLSSGRGPGEIVAASGLTQISDESELGAMVDGIIAAHPDVVEQIRSGKTGAVNFLTGQVMRQTKGQANPEVVTRLITERLQPA